MTRYYGGDDGYDDMTPEIVLTTERVSRKTRTCATCLGEIRPGERYTRHFIPADAGHSEHMTITGHVSPAICYVVMNQE